MSLNVFWFIPTHGDSRYLGTSQGARAVDADYLSQVAGPERGSRRAAATGRSAKDAGWCVVLIR